MKGRLNLYLLVTVVFIIAAGCATNQEIKETDPDELLNQDRVFSKKGQHDRAIAYYSKAIEINPRLAEAYNNRGQAYFANSQNDKACSDWKSSCELGLCVHFEVAKREGYCK